MGDRTANVWGEKLRVAFWWPMTSVTGLLLAMVLTVSSWLTTQGPARADTIRPAPVQIGSLCPSTAAAAGGALTSPFQVWLRPEPGHDRDGTALPTGSAAADLQARLRAADIALLGEIHDNPEHHQQSIGVDDPRL